MDARVFHDFCARIGELSVAELRALREALAARRAGRGAGPDRRARGAAAALPALRGEGLRPWGQTRTGLRRFRCATCRRTFSSATGTAVARIRLVDKFAALVAEMFAGGVPGSCRGLAARLGVGRMTIWQWRMRVLAALDGVGAPALYGIVEADETLVRESRKASREWARHLESPRKFPRPDRPRRREMRGTGRREGRREGRETDPWRWHVPWHVPVLVLSDRAEGRRADLLPDRRPMRIVEALARHIGHDAALCSDRADAYQTFARLRGQPHWRIDARHGPRVLDGAFHIQTVNTLHGRLDRFLAPFCGPATRYLQRYLDWFLARLDPVPDHPADAWRRILAA